MIELSHMGKNNGNPILVCEKCGMSGLKNLKMATTAATSNIVAEVKVCNENLTFLFLNQNICCGYSKEPSL